MSPPVVGLGTVLLLAAVQFAAFVDRATPAVIAGALKAEFALSDSQIGALQGPAFALTYAAAMLAAGHWGRRIEPLRLMALCVAVWTTGGIAFALAQTYPALLAARMVLGVGQAAFAPAALMVLGSAGVTIGRARAVSMFTTGSAVGRSGSLFLGGAVLLVVAGQTVVGLEPWRTATLALVLPNLALIGGLLWLARGRRGFSDEPTRGLRTAAAWLAGEGRTIGGLLVASAGCVLSVQAAGAWMPSILMRAFGLDGGEAAMIIGAVVLVAAPTGHLSAGWLLGWSRMRRTGPGPVILFGLAVASLGALGLMAAPTLPTTLACLGVMVAGSGMAAASSLIGLQPLTPDSIRGGVNAIFLATVSVVGVGLGPWITGTLSDLGGDTHSALKISLAQVVIAIALIVIPVAIWQGRRWIPASNADKA
jgi:MFS family permease